MPTTQDDEGGSDLTAESSTIPSPSREHMPVPSLATVQSFDDTVDSEPASEIHASEMSDGLSNISEMCVYCQNIYAHWPALGESRTDKLIFEHHGNRSSVLESAARGCSLCSQFVVKIDSMTDLELSDDQWVGLEYNRWKFAASGASNGTVLFVRKYQSGKYFWGINLFVPVVEGQFRSSCNDDKIPARVAIKELSDRRGLPARVKTYYSQLDVIPISEPDPLMKATSSHRAQLGTENALPLAKAWLQNCQNEHESCGHSPNTNFVPTRLVDLSGSRPRLHVLDPAKSNVQYATLSHCWGLKLYTVLKRINLQQFQHAIPTEAISVSFKHAMSITKYLGLQYVWIDSLCIIQDSTEDWRKEAGLMSNVYSGSAINIVAAGAKDGADGCFTTRRSCWMCRLKIVSMGVASYFVCLPVNFYKQSLDDMPLMKRAWALQERVLPSRSLHFTQSQVFCECNELHACEALQDGYDYQDLGEPTSLRFDDARSIPRM